MENKAQRPEQADRKYQLLTVVVSIHSQNKLLFVHCLGAEGLLSVDIKTLLSQK